MLNLQEFVKLQTTVNNIMNLNDQNNETKVLPTLHIDQEIILEHDIVSFAISRNQEFIALGLNMGILRIIDTTIDQSYSFQTSTICPLLKVAFTYFYDYIIICDSMPQIMIYILDGFGNISLVNKFKLIEDSFLIDIWHTVNNDVLFVTANHGILLRCFNDIKIGSFTFENRIKKEQIDAPGKVQFTKVLEDNSVKITSSWMPDETKLFVSSDKLELFCFKINSQTGVTLQEQIEYIQIPLKTDVNQLWISQIFISECETLLCIAWNSENKGDQGFFQVYYMNKKVMIYQKEINDERFQFSINRQLNHAYVIGTEFEILDFGTQDDQKPITFKAKYQDSSEDVESFQFKGYKEQFPCKILFTNLETPFPSFKVICQDGTIFNCIFKYYNVNFIEHLPYIFWVDNLLSLDLEYKSCINQLMRQYLEVHKLRKKQPIIPIFVGSINFSKFQQRESDYQTYKHNFPKQFEEFIMHNKKNIMEAKNKLEQSKSQEKEKSEKAPVQPFPDKKNPKIGNQDELLLLIKSTFQSKIDEMEDVENILQANPIDWLKLDYDEEPDEKYLEYLQVQVKNINSTNQQMTRNYGFIISLYGILKKLIDVEGTEQRQDLELQINDPVNLTFLKIVTRSPFMSILHLNLNDCAFVFDDTKIYYKILITNLNKFVRLQYATFTKNRIKFMQAETISNKIVPQLEFYDLSYNFISPNLAGFNNKNLIQGIFEHIITKGKIVSLRQNLFTDFEGQLLIKAIKNCNDLRIFDVSGNKGFDTDTLIAVKHLNQQTKNEEREGILNMNFLGKSFLNENKQDQIQIKKEDLEPKEVKLQNHNSLMIENKLEWGDQKISVVKIQNDGEEFHRLVENSNARAVGSAPGENIDKSEDTMSQSQSQFSSNSLELLIVEFDSKLTEQAMKQVTDQIIVNGNKNFYIYVVSNQEEDPWDLSIAAYYTRDLYTNPDQLANCANMSSTSIFSWCENMFKCFTSKIKIFCQTIFSSFCITKYFICGFCTFLQTSIGTVISYFFGIIPQSYLYNPRKKEFSDYLSSHKNKLLALFLFNTIGYFSLVLITPFIYSFHCGGLMWTGHFIYLGYALFAFFMEAFLINLCTEYGLTKFYFQKNPNLKYLAYVKDLFLSQMFKFNLYTQISFGFITYQCQNQIVVSWLLCVFIIFDILLTFIQVLRIFFTKLNKDIIDIAYDYTIQVDFQLVPHFLEKVSAIVRSRLGPLRIVKGIQVMIFQDIPMVVLQIIYVYYNPQILNVGIMLLSFILTLSQFWISIIRVLQMSKANQINLDIVYDQVFQDELLTDGNDKKLLIDNYINLQKNFNQDQEEISGQKAHKKFKLSNLKANVFIEEQQNEEMEENNNNNAMLSIEDEKEEIKNIILSQAAERDKATQIKFLLDEYVKSQQTIESNKNLEESEKKTFQISKPKVFEAYLDVDRQYFNQEQNSSLEGFNVNINKQDHWIESSFTHVCWLNIQAIQIERILKDDSEKHIDVLDVGTCSGLFTLQYYLLCVKMIKNLTFTSIDINPAAIEYAKACIKRFDPSIIKNNCINFEVMDIQKLYKTSKQFDLVHFNFGIHYLASNIQKLVKFNGALQVPIWTRDGAQWPVLFIKNQPNEPFFTQIQQSHMRNADYSMMTSALLFDQNMILTLKKKIGNCDLCGQGLTNELQYFCPWNEEYICANCFKPNFEQTPAERYKERVPKYFNNLVCLIGESSEVPVGSLGKNKIGRKNSIHSISCNGCKSNPTYSGYYGPRYLCLGCDKGQNGWIDLCPKCGDEYLYQGKQELLLGQREHKIEHCLLRITFSSGGYYDI